MGGDAQLRVNVVDGERTQRAHFQLPGDRHADGRTSILLINPHPDIVRRLRVEPGIEVHTRGCTLLDHLHCHPIVSDPVGDKPCA
jgi:hypothetical protein